RPHLGGSAMRSDDDLGWHAGTRCRQKRHPRRCANRPTLEILEARRLPALGLFVENFSDDLDPARPGFDSWDSDPNTTSPDEFMIPHQVGPGVFIDENTVLRSTGDLPSPPHSLLLSPGETRATYLIDFDAIRGQPGGLGIDEEIASVAIRYSGLGSIAF